MRSELEAKLEQFGGNGNEPCGCGKCIVCRVFGMHKPRANNLGPSRIIVRDAQLLEGGETELKSENVIDRKNRHRHAPAERLEAASSPGPPLPSALVSRNGTLDKDAEYLPHGEQEGR